MAAPTLFGKFSQCSYAMLSKPPLMEYTYTFVGKILRELLLLMIPEHMQGRAYKLVDACNEFGPVPPENRGRDFWQFLAKWQFFGNFFHFGNFWKF